MNSKLQQLKDDLLGSQREFSTALEVIEYVTENEIELAEQDVFEIASNVWEQEHLLTMLIDYIALEADYYLRNVKNK